MKKSERILDDGLLFDLRKVYLADTLIREFNGYDWEACKQKAEIILNEIAEVQELYRD